jgi:hypothetical protein
MTTQPGMEPIVVESAWPLCCASGTTAGAPSGKFCFSITMGRPWLQ